MDCSNIAIMHGSCPPKNILMCKRNLLGDLIIVCKEIDWRGPHMSCKETDLRVPHIVYSEQNTGSKRCYMQQRLQCSKIAM